MPHQSSRWFPGVWILFLQVLNFPSGLGPEEGQPLPHAHVCSPLGLSPPLAGYLLSLFTVFLFLLMIGSSAFSNWWLGLWLDKGSRVSFPLALEDTESVSWSKTLLPEHLTAPATMP